MNCTQEMGEAIVKIRMSDQAAEEKIPSSNRNYNESPNVSVGLKEGTLSESNPGIRC